jgi:hypothetical protein
MEKYFKNWRYVKLFSSVHRTITLKQRVTCYYIKIIIFYITITFIVYIINLEDDAHQTLSTKFHPIYHIPHSDCFSHLNCLLSFYQPVFPEIATSEKPSR